MSYEAMSNMSQGQLITEAMMDRIRENIEFLAGLQAFGEDLSTLDDNSEIGGTRIVTGSYEGDNTYNRVITGVGFTPRTVRVAHYTNPVLYNDYTGETSLPYGTFISIQEDGFEVSYSAVGGSLNESPYEYLWIAIGY